MGRRGTDAGPRSPHCPSRPRLPPQPIRLTIRLVASPEISERWELLLFPQRSGELSRDFNRTVTTTAVTHLGQAPGVPAPSHLSKASHPFPGQPSAKAVSAPPLCLGGVLGGEAEAEGDQRRHLLSHLQTSSGFKGDARK